MVLGVVGGTALSGSDFLGDFEEVEVETREGSVFLAETENFLFLKRHGRGGDIPPHMINHRANILALEESGVEGVVGVGSVGALKIEYAPPCVVVPDDYMNFSGVPTFFDDEVKHVTPGFDEGLRGRLVEAAGRLPAKAFIKGVYVQTRGPRLETKAEVRMLATFADIVGMTLASEATLARELEIPYAALCSVDNLAHGLSREPLDSKKIVSDSQRTGELIVKVLEGML